MNIAIHSSALLTGKRSGSEWRISANRSQRGVGLIEILVAVLLISMGFLAAARMQVEGMRFSQSAYHQSQAYFLASDMIDRMRSNIDGVTDGHYSGMTTSASASNPKCDEVQCNVLEIARQDLFDWSASLHPLAGTSGFVPALQGTATASASGTIADLGNGIYSVTMAWNEVIQGQDTQQSLLVQFALENPE